MTVAARLRLARRIAGIAGALILCLPLHYAWKLAGRRSPWPRRFLFMVAFAAGMRPRVTGSPLKRQVLFLANHVSWLDIMLVAGTSGAAFVSKAEVADWPLFGWLASLNDSVFVAREQKRAVQGQADALRTALAGGRAVALFPEGTTEGGHRVLPFRASLLAALFPPLPGIRVQPVAIDYGPAVEDIAWVGDEGAAANALRILSRKGIVPVGVHYLQPVDPQ
ncbi:MAG: 1-acyl-sn-glycerol-3-phosphate acyltransferase, partial [Alphaproteobacteria bacterium]|nr:1-acyl-sn-glycerol-3-phosphate acyltransferase [Alphaproteobacteria bacterium]